jgi:hypothetical protein
MAEYKRWQGLCLDRALPTNVDALYSHFFRELFNSASRVILIKGLPEEADINFVMTHLLTVGSVATIRLKNKIYMTNGYLGGDKDVNYFGTKIIGANPVLGSYELERGKDAEITFLTPYDNIPLMQAGIRESGGIYSLITYTAALLADNICSLNTAQINGRVQVMVTAEDASIASSAESVLKDLYSGKPYRVMTEELYKRIHVNPCASSVQAHQLMELVEVQQYIRAMFWNAIGIDSNYNMKRERLISAEVESNYTALKVPVTTMLETLNDGFSRTNKALGTELHAELNPEYKIVKLQKEESEPDGGDKTTQASDTGSSVNVE